MKFVALFALLIAAVPAQASILLGPSVSYTTQKSTDNTGFLTTDDESVLYGEGKLGVLIEGSVLYIGGLYSYQSSTSSSSKMTGSNYGPSLGIFDGAFALIGTYILGGDRTYKVSGSDYKISSASGIRVDVSYVAGVTGSIGIGPQLTYRDIKYAKSTPPGSAESTKSYQESGFYPSIILWFRF